MDVSRTVAFVSVALIACSSGPRDVVVSNPVPRVDDARARRAAPVGTAFTIALLEELGTEWSVAHQTFRAVLLGDITASDGSIVARAGTPLYGVVTRVRSGDDPLLAIDFPGVTTASGAPAPLAAKLKDAPSDTPGEDAALTKARVAGAAPYAGEGRYYDPRTKVIHVPRGGRLRLQLTRPLVVP